MFVLTPTKTTLMCAIPHNALSACNASFLTAVSTDQRRSPSISAEAIISLVFGITMFLIAVLTIWQGHKHRQEFLSLIDHSQHKPTAGQAVDLSHFEHCALVFTSSSQQPGSSAISLPRCAQEPADSFDDPVHRCSSKERTEVVSEAQSSAVDSRRDGGLPQNV